jgi:hypothetical protein
MARNAKSKRKRAPKTVLKLPDLEQSKSAVLNSLTSPSSQRSYDHAIREFIDWYCSEPRLAFNKTVVTRYRISLEQRHYAPSTINLRLAAVRRLAYEASDCGLLSPDLAAGIRRVKGARRLGVRIGNWLTGRRGQTHDRLIWFISSKTEQEPRHDCCFNRMRSQKGGGCCSEIRGCPTPGRTLGDCRSEWKRRSHPHRSDAKLGEDGNRRMGNTCWNQFRSALSSHQQSGKSVGKRFHAEGDLVHRERGSRQLRSGGPCST